MLILHEQKRQGEEQIKSKRYFEAVADQWDSMRGSFFGEKVREKAFDTAGLQPGKLVITDLDEHDIGFLKTEHHDRWMGFERKNIRQWFIEAGLKKVSVDCVEEKCTSESIRIERFFHREIMLLSHSLPFIPVRLYNELESLLSC